MTHELANSHQEETTSKSTDHLPIPLRGDLSNLGVLTWKN